MDRCKLIPKVNKLSCVYYEIDDKELTLEYNTLHLSILHLVNNSLHLAIEIKLELFRIVVILGLQVFGMNYKL
jgi:hypothetical protein